MSQMWWTDDMAWSHSLLRERLLQEKSSPAQGPEVLHEPRLPRSVVSKFVLGITVVSRPAERGHNEGDPDMTGKLVREAAHKSTGMTCAEIMDAIVAARSAGMPMLVRTKVGFKGQIQSMEFTERDSAPAHEATTRIGAA